MRSAQSRTRPLAEEIALAVAPQRPLFLTGSGPFDASWLDRVLSRAPGILCYHEPCDPVRNGIAGAQADAVWCRYLRPGDSDAYFEYTLNAAFRGHFWRGCGFSPGASGRFCRPPRILVQEAAAFLSVEWVAARWQPEVIILLRHPAAHVAAIRAAGQEAQERARLHLLLANPALREGPLAPLRDRLAAIEEPLEAAAACWGIRTSVVLEASLRHPDWTVLRFEDLARDPLAGLRGFFERFGLTWSEDLARRLRTQARPGGPLRPQAGDWRALLTAAERARIRRLLEPFALPVYADPADWD